MGLNSPHDLKKPSKTLNIVAINILAYIFKCIFDTWAENNTVAYRPTPYN